MEVNPSLPVKTVAEFITYANANPGKINFGSGGIGTTVHLAGELFKIMTGINLIHVPYRGSPQAITDLIGGQIQVMFDLLSSSSIEHVRNGKLRALAVTTATRSDVLPDIPAISEVVSGYEAMSWGGIGAPKNTPNEIVEKLNREVSAALVDPKMQESIVNVGSVPMSMTPRNFGKLIADDAEKWGKVVRAANIKAE